MIHCNRCNKESTIDYGGDLTISENFGVHEQSTRLYTKTGLCRKCGERDSMIARSVINCFYEIMPSLWRIPKTIKDLNASMTNITHRIDQYLRYIKERFNNKEAEAHKEAVSNPHLATEEMVVLNPGRIVSDTFSNWEIRPDINAPTTTSDSSRE